MFKTVRMHLRNFLPHEFHEFRRGLLCFFGFSLCCVSRKLMGVASVMKKMSNTLFLGNLCFWAKFRHHLLNKLPHHFCGHLYSLLTIFHLYWGKGAHPALVERPEISMQKLGRHGRHYSGRRSILTDLCLFGVCVLFPQHNPLPSVILMSLDRCQVAGE